MSAIPRTPPPELFRGELDSELVVLSLPTVRIALRLDKEVEIETADGLVNGRPGDFVITTPSGESFPVLEAVYYGTYRILGRVGKRYVGQRLLHARRAWPVKSEIAELHYGPGRGTVAAQRGGWVYQSDDNDYGFINADLKEQAHVVVGKASELSTTSWRKRFRIAVLAIGLLPPTLSFSALLAFAARVNHPRASELLLATEALLPTLGVATVWWVQKQRWALKAAVDSAFTVSREFQIAAEALGERPSDMFPGMTLWRAAQSDRSGLPRLGIESLRAIKSQVQTTCARMHSEIEQHDTVENRVTHLSRVSAGLVIASILAATIWTKMELFEFAAIWLPTVVGAIHASISRRQIVRRISAGRQFLSELKFVRTQLFALVPDDSSVPVKPEELELLGATIKMLCRATAEHTQHQVEFAISEGPNLPV
jgi:hypothetical protein